MNGILFAETLHLCSNCTAPLLAEAEPCLACDDDSVRPERIGPFEIVDELGRGPHGRVYLCQNPAWEEWRVVKLLACPSSVGETCIRHTRLAARINHKNVLGVKSIGRAAGVPFITMEALDGRSLQSLLPEFGRLDERVSLHLIRSAARALEAALELGLIHGDLRPSNFFVAKSGEVKLSDFGHNAGRERSDPGLRWTAPEYATGERLDHRSDIYSLGHILYTMLTGTMPPRQSPDATECPDILEARSDLHPTFVSLLERMMTPDRDARFSGYDQVIEAIDDCLDSLSRVDRERFGFLGTPWPLAPGEAARLGVPAVIGAALVAAAMFGFGSTPLKAVESVEGRAMAMEPAVVREANLSTPMIASVPEPPTTFTARYEYMLGAQEAQDSLVTVGRGRNRTYRKGGRIVIPRGDRYSVLHEHLVSGDVDAVLSFVPRSNAPVELVFQTDDDRRVVARFKATASGETSVSILTGNPLKTVQSGTTHIRPNVAHLVEVRRQGRETRLHLDGHEVLRAHVSLSGAFRVGVRALHGGAELRHLRFRAERDYGVSRRT